MKIGNFEIKATGANEAIIGAVILLTFILIFAPEVKNLELFKLGFVALISWGAGYATGKKPQEKEL